MSIFGIRIGQSRRTLLHLVSRVDTIEKCGEGLESWHFVGSREAEQPDSIRFVDGIVSRVTGRSLSVNGRNFRWSATKKELFSELPALREYWNDGWSLKTGNVELNVIFLRTRNDYLLADIELMSKWTERVHYPDLDLDVRPSTGCDEPSEE